MNRGPVEIVETATFMHQAAQAAMAGCRTRQTRRRAGDLLFHEPRPVFLLGCYGKGSKSDLTSADRAAVRAVIEAIHDEYEE